MDEDQSQKTELEQEGTEQEERTTGRKVIERPADTQVQEQEKSNESEEKETEELFELPDGRKVPAQELSKEWKENFYPEFTRRSQQLAEFKKAEEARKAEAEAKARNSVEESDVLKNVAPEVKEAIIKIVSPEIERVKEEIYTQSQRKEAEEAFDRQMEALEKEFPGGDGRPKFDRVEVLREMQKENNKNFDPRSLFKQMHEEEFLDYSIKEALKKQKGGLQTESTGKTSHTPEKKTPKDFEEASRAAEARIRSL
jgi:hypothetical protein